MTSVKEKRFEPDPAAHAVYNELYAFYRELHDEFGGVSERGPRERDETLLAIRAGIRAVDQTRACTP